MNLASLKMVPSMLVLLTRSDPAKSTRFSLDLLTVSSPAWKKRHSHVGRARACLSRQQIKLKGHALRRVCDSEQLAALVYVHVVFTGYD